MFNISITGTNCILFFVNLKSAGETKNILTDYAAEEITPF